MLESWCDSDFRSVLATMDGYQQQKSSGSIIGLLTWVRFSY